LTFGLRAAVRAKQLLQKKPHQCRAQNVGYSPLRAPVFFFIGLIARGVRQRSFVLEDLTQNPNLGNRSSRRQAGERRALT
jgi:hypothetical protein